MFGLLNVNKPQGWTSRDVVNRVARRVRPAKAGHAGTLDPLATGVLLVCVGQATRLVPLIHEYSKEYIATFLFGRSSETDDIEGELHETPIPTGLTRDDLERQLARFVGEIQQVPPAYSAIKVQGERAYRAARRGEAVELAPRTVTVHQLEVLQCDFPTVSLRIECGSGFYVRSFGRDLARAVGTEAVMSELKRTRIGPFPLEDALDVDDLNDVSVLRERLISPLVATERLPQVVLPDPLADRLSCGQSVELPETATGLQEHAGEIAVASPTGRLRAIASLHSGRLAPKIVFPMKE